MNFLILAAVALGVYVLKNRSASPSRSGTFPASTAANASAVAVRVDTPQVNTADPASRPVSLAELPNLPTGVGYIMDTPRAPRATPPGKRAAAGGSANSSEQQAASAAADQANKIARTLRARGR
jgi:hypothetical protein